MRWISRLMGCGIFVSFQTDHLTEVEKEERKINLESVNRSINIGDIVATLFSLGFVVLVIFLIIQLFRTNNKRKQQLDRIEKKIDELNKQSKIL